MSPRFVFVSIPGPSSIVSLSPPLPAKTTERGRNSTNWGKLNLFYLSPYFFFSNSESLTNFFSFSCSVNETLLSSLFSPQFRHSPHLPSPLTVAPDHQRCFRKIHRALHSRRSCWSERGIPGNGYG